MGYWINFDTTGIRVHLDDCRYASKREKKPENGRWEWAATEPDCGWKMGERKFRECKVCKPDLSLLPSNGT